MTTPRAFIIRHGETEWSLNGRHTGTSDIPLTSNGQKRILATGKALVGDDRLIVPSKLAHMWVLTSSRALPSRSCKHSSTLSRIVLIDVIHAATYRPVIALNGPSNFSISDAVTNSHGKTPATKPQMYEQMQE